MEEFRRAVSGRKITSLLVDQRELVRITPAAALVLLAEMYRANKLYKRVSLSFVQPLANEARDLLGEIGFYDYAKTITWKNHGGSNRRFWKHHVGEGVRPDLAGELIHYLPRIGTKDTALLYEALVEGMQNAAEWAYMGQTRYRSWWLLGYREDTSGELAFCFYDQGAGIPATIRTRFRDMFPIFRPSGSELIQLAVMKGRYSRTKQKSRGRGLPTLKRFIDSAKKGELLIFSRESRCIFHASSSPECDDYQCDLQGTLISWTLQRNAE